MYTKMIGFICKLPFAIYCVITHFYVDFALRTKLDYIYIKIKINLYQSLDL